MLSERVTHRNIVRVLFAGFALVMILLVAATLVSVTYVQSIRRAGNALMSEQFATTRLINQVQRAQAAMSAVFHKIAREPESLDPQHTLKELDAADQAIRRSVAAAAGTKDEAKWRDLDQASSELLQEVRSYLDARGDSPARMHGIAERYRRVLGITSALVAASGERSTQAELDIERQVRQLAQRFAILLGACLVLALVCAVLTIRTTAELFRRMEWQAGELSRVSWQMLGKQEYAARRFSHELHDELGQALTAIKANLISLDGKGPSFKERKADCLHVVDEAIENVRELSQLLRPIILDDFGLDAALRWLAERFSHRSGIEVDYSSQVTGRVTDETETNLFRIAQEALTNVARHSEATRIKVSLENSGNALRLRISDNGKGLPSGNELLSNGLGMVGMRARARAIGGELTVQSRPGEGVTVEAVVPVQASEHETAANTNSARG